MTQQIKILIIFCLFLFILLFSILKPGLFSIDEASYILMTKSLVKNFSLELKNGYEEYPTWQFHILSGEIVGNKVVGKYPPFYSFLAIPFFIFLGIKGFFLINLSAFILTILVLYFFAIKITNNRNIALSAVAIYCFCTFSIEYALAIWPHMISAAIILISYFFFEIYFERKEENKLLIFLCGILIAVAICVRLQNVIHYALIAGLLLLFSKQRVLSVSLLSLGILPGIIILSIVNYYRFGFPDPFSYGAKKNLGFYFDNPQVLFFLVLCLTIMYLLFYFRNIIFEKKRLAVFIGAFALVCAGVIIALKVKDIYYYMPRMFYHNFVNYVGYFDKSYPHAKSGAIIFNNIIKKSLLQSCPFLILSFTAPFFIKKCSDSNRQNITLVTAFLGPLIFTSFFLFHGGFCFNYRYALDTIPFGLLLVIQFFKVLKPRWKDCISPLLIFLVIAILFKRLPFDNIFRQYVIIYFPLFLSCALLFLSLMMLKQKNIFPLKRIFIFFLLLSFLYSSIVCIGEDFVASRRYRKSNLDVTSKLNSFIPDDSLILMGIKIPLRLLLLKEKKNVRIAYAPITNVSWHTGMIDFFLLRNKPVFFFSTKTYYSMKEDAYRQIIEARLGKFYNIQRIKFQDYIFYRITQKKPDDKA